MAERFARFLPATAASPEAVCHTAAFRRTHHEHRLALVGRSNDELAARLAPAGTAAAGVTGRAEKGRRPRLVTLADAARVICLRANLLAALRGQGAMAVVALSRHALAGERGELAAYGDRLHLAASNGPSLSVVSGEADAIADFQRTLADRDVFCRPVRAAAAGHSPVVDPVARAVATELAQLRPGATSVPMYSSVTGGPVAGEDLDGGYWGRNLRQPVLFCPAIEHLADDGYDLYLELSPNPALVIPIQQTLDERGRPGHAFGSLARRRDDRETLLEAFGALYVHGVPVDFSRIHGAPLPVVSLPSAPWQHERVWFQDAPAVPGAAPRPTATVVPVSTADTVAKAFAGVLRMHPIGPDDSFFEKGGTSLMAAQMLYELRASLAREIPLRLLFDDPTVAGLTRALEARRTATSSDLTTAPALVRTDAVDFPLSINQERVLSIDPRHYPRVVAQHLLLEGPLDLAVLERALQRVLEVHDGLRTVYVEAGGGEGQKGVRQKIADPPAVDLPLTDLSDTGGGEADLQKRLQECLREAENTFSPFDGPMYRFGVVRLGEHRHVFSIVVDHLIADAWSIGVLFHDMVHAYDAHAAGQADSLVPTPLRFVDYAHWERTLYSGTYLQERLEYWRTNLRDIQAPCMWFMRHRDVDTSTLPEPHLIEIEIEIDEARFTRLEEVARATATTTPMVILTGFLLAVRRHCGQDRVALPVNTSGRERPDLQKIVGFLSSIRLVTVDFSGDPTRRHCLARTRDAMLEADEEQGLSMSQYAYLEGLAFSGVPFRIAMEYLPDVDLPTHLGQATVTMLPRQTPHKFPRDVVLFVRQIGGRLRLSFGYAAGVVSDDGMARFTADMAARLGELADDLDGIIEPLPAGNATTAPAA